MDSPEAQLVAATLRGERAAAGQLVEAFHARIFAFLRRLTGNEADAADLTQQTFARVWTSLATFAGRSSVSSWMHGIAWHVHADWRRREGRFEARSEEWWEACPARGASPDDLAEAADLSRETYAAVDRLEADLRATVHLHYYQGLTLQETADALGIATSTVKYRLRAALAGLQKALADSPSRSAVLATPRHP